MLTLAKAQQTQYLTTPKKTPMKKAVTTPRAARTPSEATAEARQSAAKDPVERQRALKLSKQRSMKKIRKYKQQNAQNSVKSQLRHSREEASDRFADFWRSNAKTDHGKEHFCLEHTRAKSVKIPKEQHECYTYPPSRRFGMSEDPLGLENHRGKTNSNIDLEQLDNLIARIGQSSTRQQGSKAKERRTQHPQRSSSSWGAPPAAAMTPPVQTSRNGGAATTMAV